MSGKRLSDTDDDSVTHQTHHIVLGAGMIGCYLAASFVHVNQAVSVVARPNIIARLKQNYSISDYQGNHFSVTSLPTLISIDSSKASQKSSLSALPKQADVLWLTVKCISIDDAIATIRECISENTLIICCQNGVNSHLNVQHAFPNNTVIRAMVPFNVISDKVGHFYRGSQGHLVLERNESISDSVHWIARQINSKHLPVDTSFEMTALQWAKLQLNLGNAVCALADIPVKEMLENSDYRRFISRLMQELLVITHKRKIKLPKIASLPNKWIPYVLDLPTWLFKLVAQQMLAIDPKVRTSMWWDLQENRLTEIDFLNGKVTTSASELGVKAPANELLVKLIKQVENGKKVNASAFLKEVKNANELSK
jgi:2-dehydropantoate 2-reductase